MTTLEATVAVTVMSTIPVDTGRIDWTDVQLTLVHVYTHTTSSVTAVLSPPCSSLPKQLRQPDVTFAQFKRSLKTFVFG